MRILRFSPPGGEPTYGLLTDENEIQLLAGDPLYSQIQVLDKFFQLSDVKVLAPVIPRSKVVCVGKNYADHAAEMGGEVPQEPIIFIKPNTSVIGPGDLISWPKQSDRIDHEAELAIVISKICRDVPADKYQSVIYGYTLANDVTARDLQQRDGQWTRAKSFDTFCPLGPWIDTEFLPSDQEITCYVAGELRQRAKLSEMIFKVPEIIEFVTSVMTLLPGDVILTGTPAGIGPLQRGADVKVAISGLGELTNLVSR